MPGKIRFALTPFTALALLATAQAQTPQAATAPRRSRRDGDSGPQGGAAVDVARRFGKSHAFGTRLNAADRAGGTAIDDEAADF